MKIDILNAVARGKLLLSLVHICQSVIMGTN